MYLFGVLHSRRESLSQRSHVGYAFLSQKNESSDYLKRFLR